MKRFQKNQFFREKNPTIVNFPVKNLALGDIVPLPEGGPLCAWHRAVQAMVPSLVWCAGKAVRYDLIANVVHEGLPDRGTYHAQVCSSAWCSSAD